MKTSGQRRSLYIQAIVLFFVAALPRLVDLAAFVNPDERRWLDRSADLLRALSTGDLSLAYHSGNPAGIITKWCGLAGIWGRYLLHSLGWRAHLDPGMAASRDLWTFLEAIQKQPQNVQDVLGAARVPVVLLTALMVVVAYLLLRRLWGEWVALFVVLFMVAITFSAKKNDRYLLPVFPAPDILTGMGLVKGMEHLWGRARTEVRSIHPGKGLGFKP